MRYILVMLLFISSYASSVWHKENLYDNATMSYYIPYELWLQVPWDGKKEKRFETLDSKNSIKGYFNWYHPYLKKQLKVYKKNDKEGASLYTFYPKGIAKVYDQYKEAYLNNGLNFPAGYGWKTNKIYTFSQEIWIKDKHYVRTLGLQIKQLQFVKDELESITVEYYVNGTAKESRTLQPKKQ